MRVIDRLHAHPPVLDHERAHGCRLDGLDGDLQGGREVTPGWQGVPLHHGMEITLDPGDIRVFARAP